jgi:glutaminyl-peptide cyclotransferase
LIRPARWFALACALVLGATACGDATGQANANAGPVEHLRAEIIERRAHDTGAFTEGLVLDGATLYESSGGYAGSTLRRGDARSGTVLQQVSVPAQYFAEGLARVGDRLVMLTWKEHTALVYDATTLTAVGQFTYDTDGWGLCDDGRRLVMSDGTDILRFRDRMTFALLGSVRVTLDGRPVERLNELECVGDVVYANVWQTNTIVRIDVASGRVSADIDASALAPAAPAPTGPASADDVLNGIAHDPANDTFLLTGKHWPTLFVVRFIAQG